MCYDDLLMGHKETIHSREVQILYVLIMQLLLLFISRNDIAFIQSQVTTLFGFKNFTIKICELKMCHHQLFAAYSCYVVLPEPRKCFPPFFHYFSMNFEYFIAILFLLLFSSLEKKCCSLEFELCSSHYFLPLLSLVILALLAVHSSHCRIHFKLSILFTFL